MYICECMDYANGHICKHLHGIQSMRLRCKVQDDDIDDHTGKYMIVFCSKFHISNHPQWYTDCTGMDRGDNRCKACTSKSLPLLNQHKVCFIILSCCLFLLWYYQTTFRGNIIFKMPRAFNQHQGGSLSWKFHRVTTKPSLYHSNATKCLSINSVLTSSTTSSDKTVHRHVTNFKQSFGIAPGQKHETQVSFYRTTQKSGRKRKGNILK